MSLYPPRMLLVVWLSLSALAGGCGGDEDLAHLSPQHLAADALPVLECSADVSVAGSQATYRIMARVADLDGEPLVAQRLNVLASGFLSDTVSGQALPNEFATQTHQDGLIMVDHTCAIPLGLDEFTCSVGFEVDNEICISAIHLQDQS